MTGNPATQLRTIFEIWDSRSGAAQYTRDLSSEEGMQETVAALHLLDEVNRRLDFLEAQGQDATVFRNAVKDWFRDILHFGRSWTQETQRVGRRDMLRALEVLLNASSPALAFGALEPLESELGALLQEALTELKNDESLNPDLRSYLLEAINHARTCLDRFEANGVFDLPRAIKDLEILLAAAQSMSNSNADVWRRLKDRFNRFTTNPTTAAVAAAITTGGMTHLLGP